MIADLKPYPEYKESGANWLKDIPSHWEIRRMKYVLHEIDSRSTDGKEQLLRVSQYTGITQRFRADGGTEPDTRAESLQGYKRVLPDDMVINIMLAWNGSLGVSQFAGIVSPAYCVYKFNVNAYPWYFHHLLRSPVYKARIKAFSTGVVESRLRLYSDDLFRIEAIVPPPNEQAAIVRFLDYATRRIERAIRAKRKLIALLNEQKQTIIHRAVTRGLDPNAPMRDSGVDWIGEIPAHWEVLALKRVIKRLIDCEHKTAPVVDNSEYRVVRTTAIRNGKLRIHGTYCTSATAFREWTRRGIPKAGDILFTREAPAGEACIMPDGMNLCLGQRTVLIKPKRELISPLFLVQMIYAGPPRILIKLASQGSTVGHFNMSDIGAMTILCPPIQEQLMILEQIDNQTSTLNSAIDRTEREIKLLQEYRTRLIADVVTGQLDVRGAAQYLPTDEEPLPFVAEDQAEYETEELEEMLVDE